MALGAQAHSPKCPVPRGWVVPSVSAGLGLMKRQFWSLLRPHAPFLEPLVQGWGSLHPTRLSELGAGREHSAGSCAKWQGCECA